MEGLRGRSTGLMRNMLMLLPSLSTGAVTVLLLFLVLAYPSDPAMDMTPASSTLAFRDLYGSSEPTLTTCAAGCQALGLRFASEDARDCGGMLPDSESPCSPWHCEHCEHCESRFARLAWETCLIGHRVLRVSEESEKVRISVEFRGEATSMSSLLPASFSCCGSLPAVELFRSRSSSSVGIAE